VGLSRRLHREQFDGQMESAFVTQLHVTLSRSLSGDLLRPPCFPRSGAVLCEVGIAGVTLLGGPFSCFWDGVCIHSLESNVTPLSDVPIGFDWDLQRSVPASLSASGRPTAHQCGFANRCCQKVGNCRGSPRENGRPAGSRDAELPLVISLFFANFCNMDFLCDIRREGETVFLGKERDRWDM
jgi:hypothetical protein